MINFSSASFESVIEKSFILSKERSSMQGNFIFSVWVISNGFDKVILFFTTGFDLIFAISFTSVEATNILLLTFTILSSLGIVIAFRQVSVGTRFAYIQLLIQPRNIFRLPVFDHVIPAYSSGPKSNHLVSLLYGEKFFPSKSPR